MSDEEAVLAANRAFYETFAAGDADGMDALWADRAEVACIHPGWDALTGRASVMQSWREVLVQPPPIRCRGARAFLEGGNAFVICEEVISGGVLIATNLFVREADGWKLVHHHASQVLAETAVAPADDDEPAGTVH